MNGAKSRSAWAAGARRGAAALLAVVAVGCAVPPVEQQAEAEMPLPPVDTTVQRNPPAGGDRAATVEGDLSIEGMREPMTFRLYRSPDGFPLDFSTYLPEDVRPDAVSSGEDHEIRFVPFFGGTATEGAWVSIMLPSGDPGAPEARQLLRSIADSEGGAERVESGGYTWALEEYRFTGSAAGRIALGRHDGHYFYLISRYPAEMGDGFGPRIAHMLAEWRWADGSRLGS